MSISVPDRWAVGEESVPDPRVDLVSFREEFYRCLPARGDALFELTDALLCSGTAVRTVVELSLAAEHRRGHGALYDAINCGRVDFTRLRCALGGLTIPCDRGGRIVLAVDVSAWLRPDAPTSPQRGFCHVYGRGNLDAHPDRKTPTAHRITTWANAPKPKLENPSGPPAQVKNQD